MSKKAACEARFFSVVHVKTNVILPPEFAHLSRTTAQTEAEKFVLQFPPVQHCSAADAGVLIDQRLLPVKLAATELVLLLDDDDLIAF